ncbi:MAG: carboxylesterase family protein [Burkholderiaceae bacterium]|jgi:para-nitrobenzyl esterase|nr:carboxylesterase family protein [Burkholderiaceae bacterium]
MKNVPLIAASLCTALITACAAPAAPVEPPHSLATTETGTVRGQGRDVRRFLGIPYAAAPVGGLRWKPPQPAPSWQGVRDATAFGDYCIQPREYPEQRGGMSEDCLNLNIWTPAKRRDERLAVIVWIHGGGYAYGSGSHPTYDGEALARRGVVVVTLNYRLGLLGFLAHPGLTAESPQHASGNYGLMDQVAALRWVQRNIAAFGGDPGRVTAMGQSAGAHAISTLMASDLAQGSFQQAILQSVGVMRPTTSLQEAEQHGLRFGPDLAALRRRDATDFIDMQKQQAGVRTLAAGRPLAIIHDGHVVRTPDYQAYASGRFSRIPILVGNNANEGGGPTRTWPVRTVSDFEAVVRQTFPDQPDAAWQAWRVDRDDQVRQALADLYSDTEYLFGTRQLLSSYQAHGLASYRYVFSRHRNGGATAPVHGDELPYVFDNLDARHRGQQRPFDATDVAVARSMADAWARFARTGNPNGPGLPTWRPYGMAGQPFMEFASAPHPGTGHAGRGMDFVRDYFDQRRR